MRQTVTAPILLLSCMVWIACPGCKPAGEPSRGVSRQLVAKPASGVLLDARGWLHEGRAVRDTVRDAGRVYSDAGPRDAIASAGSVYMARGHGYFKSRELEEAARMYRAALREDPNLLEAHYGLARIASIRKQKSVAIASLNRIKARDTEAARGLLRKARMESDFRVFHTSDKFRAATGFMPVVVSWMPGVSREQANAVVNQLRQAQVPAVRGRKWRGKETIGTVYYAKGSRLARTMAEEVVGALPVPPRILSSRLLKADKPVVLVMIKGAQASPVRARLRTIQAYFGLPLKAQAAGEEHRLTLQNTGGFRWVIQRADQAKTVRTGRYHLSPGKISLSFSERDVSPEGKEGAVQFGRRVTYKLVLAAEGIALDGLNFGVVNPNSPSSPNGSE